MIKKILLEKSLDKIEYLFLGSSHLECSFLPEDLENSFNFGIKSLDLYYIFNLYKKYAEKMPNLKNVFLFYSPFFKGWNLAKTTHYHYCIFYKIIFNIEYKNHNLRFTLKEPYYRKKLEQIEKSIDKKQLQQYNNILTYKNYSSHDTNNLIEEVMLEKIISGLRENTRKSDSYEYLKELATDCKKNGVNFSIVLPSYPELLKKMNAHKKILFRDVYKLSKESGVEFLDLYEDVYEQEDFMDQEHFNIEGAQKFTANFLKTYMSNNY